MGLFMHFLLEAASGTFSNEAELGMGEWTNEG